MSEGEAEIQIGMMRVRTRISELIHVKDTENQFVKKEHNSTKSIQIREEKATIKKESSMSLPNSPGIELDLRGKRADDAITELERYLDAASYVGMPFVRIIHGKGTGVRVL